MAKAHQPTAVERRCATQSTVAPDDGTPVRACRLCGCVWLDYRDGRDAHVAVFGHYPKAPEDDAGS